MHKVIQRYISNCAMRKSIQLLILINHFILIFVLVLLWHTYLNKIKGDLYFSVLWVLITEEKSQSFNSIYFPAGGVCDSHFSCLLRHRTCFLLVSCITSRISSRTTSRYLLPPFFKLALGSTIMVYRTRMGPSNC